MAVLISVLAASCSTDGDVPFGFDTVGPADLPPRSSDFAQATVNPSAAVNPEAGVTATAYMMDENDPSLPDAVASAPQMRPGSETDIAAIEPGTPAAEPEQVAALVQPQADAPQPGAAPDAPVEAEQPQVAAAEAQGEWQPTQVLENSPQPIAVASAPEPKKRGFLSAFFGNQARASAPQPVRPLIQQERGEARVAATAPMTQLASTQPVPEKPLVQQPSSASGEALPGVRQNALFEIKRRSGLDDDSDIDLHEGDDAYQVASAAGLARLAPNGLLKQTEHVDVACLKPSLVRVLKTIEGHYGKKVVVTSGYRNPDRNRQARGARNSLHMYCAAADIQVEGISKWDLAAFMRTMPGRGGVGTYCHTNSVHVDVGPERDWNWRCRRRG